MLVLLASTLKAARVRRRLVERRRTRAARLIVTAMRGTAPLSFATSEPCSEAEGQVGFLLQQIWFAALVGWMGGVQDEETIVEHMASAADILIKGAELT